MNAVHVYDFESSLLLAFHRPPRYEFPDTITISRADNICCAIELQRANQYWRKIRFLRMRKCSVSDEEVDPPSQWHAKKGDVNVEFHKVRDYVPLTSTAEGFD